MTQFHFCSAAMSFDAIFTSMLSIVADSAAMKALARVAFRRNICHDRLNCLGKHDVTMMIEREAMRAFGHETWIIFRNTPLGITGERGWVSS